MNLKTKIKAFTLSEMVIVMILTAIVVGLAFSILTIVQNHMKKIQGNLELSMELNKLEQSFNLDFNRFSKIEYDHIEDALLFSSELEDRTYFFGSDYIIKDKDTFHIRLHQKQFYFDGDEIVFGKIDALKLETTKATQNQVIFVFRQNDATLYMN
ncbi:type II secretion system protein J [Gelidibacter sp. F63206]|uniref:PulJ/GspJ family protein n=1 Tax=Gelidibacter sp. F63206 TaxID=2926425 RepID=UPI001FF4C7BB|nr:prepilin-type N-terminal cleavage/methylation domain-containing protein [Gelidibacter sp. F63206]MCK0115175.1 prepilin-type N-terminal cleavage/methylation domain-containing protein [Gelidibacter sp. F63206]